MVPSRRSISFADFMLDPVTGLLLGPAGRVSTGRQRKRILISLLDAAQRGDILHRSVLREVLWGADPAGGADPRSIDVHVCKLRANLKLVGSSAAIITFRDVGYQLVDAAGAHLPLRLMAVSPEQLGALLRVLGAARPYARDDVQTIEAALNAA